MIVDKESFTELCIQLKLISDGIMHAAVSLKGISGAVDAEHNAHFWHRAVSGLEASILSVQHMERLMSALLHAQEITPSATAGTA